MKKIRLLTVDASNVMQYVLMNFAQEHSHIEHVGMAFNAQEARNKIRECKPDVITLDIEMPDMNGLDFLQRMMNVSPIPVVMLSSKTSEGAEITLKALELGAVDFLQKPQCGLDRILDYMNTHLVEKLNNTVSVQPQSLGKTSSQNIVKRDNLENFSKLNASRDLIAIGASTGGVGALKTVLEDLPGNLPPIIITQHMPEGSYINRFAQRLDQQCTFKVLEAQDNMELEYGHAYIAPGTHHMLIRKSSNNGYKIHLDNSDRVSGHRPSVDAMFGSIVDIAPEKKILAVILTGMGSDGAKSMLKLKQNNHSTLAQDEKTCVVYGMPRAAVEIGAVEKELPLNKISNEIIKIISP